jgi:hypothetical protein
MKKQMKTGKLGLSTDTVRRLSKPLSNESLALAAGGVTAEGCLPLTRLQGGHNCY